MCVNKKYKAIVFDLFGTLVYTFPSNEHDVVLDKMAGVLGVESATFAQIFDNDMREAREMGKYATIEENIKIACHQLGARPNPEAVRQAAAYRYEFIKKALSPRKDTIETLKQIKAQGLAIGLISDCSPEVPMLWDETPFAIFIDVAVFSCEVGIKKPSRKIYQILCERLGVNSQESLYVGDGDSSELTGALAIGMEPVLIRVGGEAERDRDRPLMAEWKGKRISTLREILKYINTERCLS